MKNYQFFLIVALLCRLITQGIDRPVAGISDAVSLLCYSAIGVVSGVMCVATAFRKEK